MKCKTCRTEFKRIGTHWSHNPSHAHEPTPSQERLIKAFLLSTGYMTNWRNNTQEIPAFRVELDSQETAEWLVERLDGLGPKIRGSSHESNDLSVRTRSNPKLEDIEEWYKWAKGQAPSVVDVEPIMIQVLYAQRGRCKRDGEDRIIKIRTSGDWDTEWYVGFFRGAGFSPHVDRNDIIFPPSQSKEMKEEYLTGNMIPGYDRVWSYL